MADTLSERPADHDRSRRFYCIKRWVLCSFGILLGFLTVCAEERGWLPVLWSRLFLATRVGTSLIGLCLTQSCAVPLLFLAGLHRPSYWYTGRLLCLLFGMIQGACVGRLSVGTHSLLGISLVVILICLMITLLIRTDLTAGGGVTKPETGISLRPGQYLSSMCQLWGAMLVLCAACDIMILLLK